MNATSGFKPTYSNMFDPPAELHHRFDQSLAKIKSVLGREQSRTVVD
ncbi:MAG: hypothetical protein HY848_19445 [Betaproteobacteria bacterium]|nr:hypothetical protein [Betaproteobacteria bacterium]